MAITSAIIKHGINICHNLRWLNCDNDISHYNIKKTKLANNSLFMVIIHFGQSIKFKIIYNNIPHTPSNVGVVARKTFSFTPDEALSVGLAKACARRIKSILFIEKSNALNST